MDRKLHCAHRVEQQHAERHDKQRIECESETRLFCIFWNGEIALNAKHRYMATLLTQQTAITTRAFAIACLRRRILAILHAYGVVFAHWYLCIAIDFD